MVLIPSIAREFTDGYVTSYTNTAGLTPVTYTFSDTQDHLKMYNNGSDTITFSVGTYSNVSLGRGKVWEEDVSFNSITLQANSSSQEFHILAKKFMLNDFTSTNNSISSINAKLADIATIPQGLTKNQDNTTLLKNVFQSYKTNGILTILIPEGTYNITDTLLDLSADDLTGLEIIGKGINKTILYINPLISTTPIFKMDNSTMNYLTVKDLCLNGTNKNGVGLKLGNVSTGKNLSRSRFENVMFNSLSKGIDGYGWIIDFISCDFRNSAMGITCNFNAVNFNGCNFEANTTGLEITGGTSVNIFGGCVEGNTIGLQLRKGSDINLYGVYFENNTSGHILAGVNSGEDIESLSIYGGSFANSQPITFDRVKRLVLRNLVGALNTGNLQITSNVEEHDIDLHYSLNGGTPDFDGYQNSTPIVAQSSAPFYSTEFTDFTTVNATNFNDIIKSVITIYPNRTNLSLDTTDYLTGKQSMKFDIPIGNINAGILITLYPAILTELKYVLALRTKLSSGLKSFYRFINVSYNTASLTNQTYTLYSSNPTLTGFNGVLGEYATSFIPIDLTQFWSAHPEATIINSIGVNVQGVTSPALTTAEAIWLDGIDLFKGLRPSKLMNERKHNFVSPYLLNPNIVKVKDYIQLSSPDGTKYKVTVANGGTLSVTVL